MRILALCDGAIRDPITGKTTIVGVFDDLQVDALPTRHGPFAVFVKLSGLNGRYDFGIEIVAPDLQTVVAVHEFSDRLEIDDPLRVLEDAVGFPAVDLPSPGRYTVRLLYNRLVADESSLDVEFRS